MVEDFTSRLVKEVRVERGLSYSVYSYFFPMYLPGTYTLGLQTRTDQAQQAAEVSLATIDKFVQEGPSEEELVLSKNNIVSGFPLRIASNRDILGIFIFDRLLSITTKLFRNIY